MQYVILHKSLFITNTTNNFNKCLQQLENQKYKLNFNFRLFILLYWKYIC
jgi:hypothetical protein